VTTPEPEDHSIASELLLYVPLLPNKAVEPTDHLPQQIQAPTKVEGPLESLWSKEPQCMKGQMGLTLVQTHKGKIPIGDAHSHPSNISDPQRQGSTIWEPAFVVLKAHVCMHKV